MCDNPITIYNNSNYINLKRFDVLRTVPCGKCVSCQRSKQLEYAIRGYYEYKECVDDGGFVYWDTLTYNDNYLPSFLGFPCFSKDDIQKYFKRLRRQLDFKFNIPSSALRYFLTCEYGSQHKRPHYHVIFFVHSNKISCSDFHQLLVTCWRNVKRRVPSLRCNGSPRLHRDGSPIYRYIYDVRGNTDLSHAADPSKGLLVNNAAITYTSKYIVKEDSYIMTLCANINDSLLARGLPSLSYQDFKDHFQPFHLQSVGFGSYLERCPGQHKYIEDLSCTLPVGFDGHNSVNNKYRLPMYYIKRLFYEPVIEPDGRLSMYKTKEYCDKLYKRESKSFDQFVFSTEARIKGINNLYNLIKNFGDHAVCYRLCKKVDSFRSLYKGSKNTLYDSIISCLHGRSVREFCSYLKYSRSWFNQKNIKTDCEEIIKHRIYDVGVVSNPLRSSSVDRYIYSRKLSVRNNLLYGSFEDLYNLLNEFNSAFSSYALLREEELREKKRDLKAIKLL